MARVKDRGRRGQESREMKHERPDHGNRDTELKKKKKRDKDVSFLNAMEAMRKLLNRSRLLI